MLFIRRHAVEVEMRYDGMNAVILRAINAMMELSEIVSLFRPVRAVDSLFYLVAAETPCSLVVYFRAASPQEIGRDRSLQKLA